MGYIGGFRHDKSEFIVIKKGRDTYEFIRPLLSKWTFINVDHSMWLYWNFITWLKDAEWT